jgi:elongation factor Ts
MSSGIAISAADVNKLRAQTGAGMMDCKKALMESEGDFEKAIDYLRKKGQKVAANRGDRDAREGYVIAKVAADATKGIILSLNCETDFVAKNDAFIQFATEIADKALATFPANAEELLAQDLNGLSVADRIIENVGKIGEKIEISHFAPIQAACVVAAMAPVALDRGDVSTEMLEREIEIGKEQARAEGKPEDKIEMIAKGKVEKFYKESTLLNQEFIKDNKKTVRQYMDENDKGLTATAFKRVALG